MVKKTILGIVVLGAIGLAVGHYLRGGSSAAAPTDVATVTVTKTKFTRRVNADGNLRAVKATQVAAPGAGFGGALKIAWLADDGINVKKDQVLVKFDPSDPEKQLRDGEADRDKADAQLRSETIKSKAAVSDRETDAALAKDELDRTRKFQSKDTMIFSRNQIIESEIDEQLANKKEEHAEQAKQIEGKRSRSNTAVIAVERKKADLAVNHATDELKKMEVVAPHDGIFVMKRNWRGEMPKLGDMLWPGQSVGEIPLLDEMEAEVFVLEVDGTGLAEKQTAEIVIEARPDKTYAGKVRRVEKLAQPRQQGSPVQYFEVVVELDKTDREVMKPGQRVRAALVLDQEDAIVVPREAVIDKDGKNVVYKRSETGFQAVPVELGAATAGRVVIAKGLAEGDVIALRDPTRTESESTGSGSAGSGKR
jgi:multidrug efflux pump subunit AcrA (membrane-fusion protein)